jgi:hypothetical protein
VLRVPREILDELGNRASMVPRHMAQYASTRRHARVRRDQPAGRWRSPTLKAALVKDRKCAPASDGYWIGTIGGLFTVTITIPTPQHWFEGWSPTLSNG